MYIAKHFLCDRCDIGVYLLLYRILLQLVQNLKCIPFGSHWLVNQFDL